MPKKYVYNSLGLDCSFNGPETAEEYNALANRPGNPVVEDAVDTIAFRSVLTAFRKAVCAALEKAYPSLPRATTKKSVKNAKGVVREVTEFDETESEYFDRIVASIMVEKELTEAAAIASLQPIADQVMAAVDAAGAPLIKFDPSVSAGGGAKKPTKEALALVENLKKAGKWDAAAQKLAQEAGVAVPTTDEELGLLIADKLRKDREAAARATTAGISAL